MDAEIGVYKTPLFVRMIRGDPNLAHSCAHFKLKTVAVAALFSIGHAISRTRPSIVMVTAGGVASWGDCPPVAAVESSRLTEASCRTSAFNVPVTVTLCP